MIVKRRYSPGRLLIAVVEALLISWALLFLAEYFGWHLVREAGGNAGQRSSSTRGPLS